MDIFSAIRGDHDKQRLLMKALVETNGNSKSRRAFFSDLKQHLTQHSVAEERHFYAPLIAEDSTIDITRHGIAEHQEIDEYLAELETTDMSSSAWLKTMKALQHKVLHHLAEEEREFFQQAGRVLTDEQKKSLAKKYQQEMQTSH
ncbi:hemerythrin domain-containing protein [Thalassotalea sediminis]|uniref:hemerythrin domain-containing protein n=1 Tax=Thalassotalea sediminis TaxID=1759089 RepID=UPI0025737CAE|nr:hemerythrin domain-containing protein [Thalassotalea sediminis]